MDTDYKTFLKDYLQKCKFEDLFDIDEIQRIQDEASLALKIGAIITTPDGAPITRPSNFSRFCEKVVRSSEKGFRNCMYSDSVLGRPNKDGPIISKCYSAGLVDAGVSIIVDGRHIANWMIGQVMDETTVTDRASLRKKAVELDIEPELFCGAFQEVPFVPRVQFEHIANLIFLIAKQLSDVGFKNYIQKAEIEYRKQVELSLEKERQVLKQQNIYDSLTGVHSRRYFDEQISLFDRNKSIAVSVVMGDVNNLKITNDIFGHDKGDELLKTIAETLKQEARHEYVIARCGGDEFKILMPNAHIDEAEAYCRRIAESCGKCRTCALVPSISLGCSERTDGQRLQDILSEAELIMYQHKINIPRSREILASFEREFVGNIAPIHDVIVRSIHIAKDFAAFLKLDKKRTENLLFALRLCDLGLIAAPDEAKIGISEKKPILHTEKGFLMAKMIDAPEYVCDAVYQSHEWWNGSGYPQGVKGTRINKYARIINLITSYVKLIDIYNMSEYDAVCEIEGCSGEVFDPSLTNKFIEFL